MPYAIGPNIQLILDVMKQAKYKTFLCICGTVLKDEISFRTHYISTHRLGFERFMELQDNYWKLSRLDLNLLGDSRGREEYARFLGSEND